MPQPLSDDLRRVLEGTVRKARYAAEAGTRAALEGLAVDRHEPFAHLPPDARALRVRLRAHARQLGDYRDAKTGAHRIDHLVAQTAYEQWHRMLFARFLAENNLLMHPDGVAVSLEECEELAGEAGEGDGWELAGRFASRMLPQIFRPEAPELQVKLAPEHQRALESLVASLDSAVFRASDSLGWVYQYWQAKRKEEINASGVKIGADELPAVTQLFTEPYMVQFLLHNTLGAWWAGKVLAERPELAENAADEDELRRACGLSGYDWTYLRFIREDETGPWRPAAGVFEGWPRRAAEITMLDPCCGSGHFVVEGLQILARLRIAEEGLPPAEAVDAALRDNIHGLEIDERCTQIAAFALAFAAWTFPDAEGFRPLPALHVACSGLALASKKEEWLALADEAARAGGMPASKDLFRTQDSLMSSRLRADLAALYDLFKDAPTLGSLIDPRALFGEMYQADFAALHDLLRSALAAERHSEETVERAVAAQGMAEAAHLLTARFHLVSTNVPYLTSGNQVAELKAHLASHFNEGRSDLATAVLQRVAQWCANGGTGAIVLPQAFLHLGSYESLRRQLLETHAWNVVARLGPRAFRGISGEVVNVTLLVLSARSRKANNIFFLDTQGVLYPEGKAELLVAETGVLGEQLEVGRNPNARIMRHDLEAKPLLSKYVECHQGLATGDLPRFGQEFWETRRLGKRWVPWQSTVNEAMGYGGRSRALLWEEGLGSLHSFNEAHKAIRKNTHLRGLPVHGKRGVLVTQVGRLPVTLFTGEHYDDNTTALVPIDKGDLGALWCFCSSGDYGSAVRSIDSSLKVPAHTLTKVPFDRAYWSAVASERYPNGLPAPYSPDPTQWLFHGHPADSIEPLQVAIARLLGYRWPPELDEAMELSDEARAWVARTADLLPFADSDGIVCIPSVRGEEPGTARIQNLLAAAFEDGWSPSKLDALLDQVGYRGKGLERWLRDGFFEQHCKLFHHRPFIWQVWDGTSDGFSALVNYHKLDRALLETLIYSYVGDWIRRQEDAARREVSGAEERLAAARALQQRLALILEGESPHDIFIRWKPIDEQPIGWEPDLDDGVRLNIRPFLTVPDVGRKGAGVLRWKPNVDWKKDRGSDPESMPWYHLGSTYGGKPGDRINDHHLTLDEKHRARVAARSKP